MKLYHGTSAAIGRAAKKDGLKPRSVTGKSNWQHTVESNPDLIYLTSCYAGYYAMNAMGDDDTEFAVIEVDTEKLDSGLFRPDEDVVAVALQTAARAGQRTPGTKASWTLNEFTAFARDNIERWADLWQWSVKKIGNCAYAGPIPAEAVTRVAIVDMARNPTITCQLFQPTITPINFRIFGKFYATLNGVLMGDDISPKDVIDAQAHGTGLAAERMFAGIYEQAMRTAKKMLEEAKSITIL